MEPPIASAGNTNALQAALSVAFRRNHSIEPSPNSSAAKILCCSTSGSCRRLSSQWWGPKGQSSVSLHTSTKPPDSKKLAGQMYFSRNLLPGAVSTSISAPPRHYEKTCQMMVKLAFLLIGKQLCFPRRIQGFGRHGRVVVMSFRPGMVYGPGRLFPVILEPVLLMLCRETANAD